MNRRGFLSSLFSAGVGATVAYSFPSIIVPKNIVVPPVGMKGLPYLINNSGWYGSFDRQMLLKMGTFFEIAGHAVRLEHDVLLDIGLSPKPLHA